MSGNSQQRNVPVNKGHFELDTPERIKAFRKKMSIGWDKAEYLQYRKEWAELPKKHIVRDYPLQVDIEMSSKCNLSCPMCYRRTNDFNEVEQTFLVMDLFKKIVDEIAGKIYALRLSWRGESTLHPDFIEAIKYAKQKGIKEVSFLTNGSKMDLSFFKMVADAGADWITWSVDGTGAIYESIRKPLKFKETFQKIIDIFHYKLKNNLTKPVIKIQTIWPAIRNNPEEYYNTFAPYVDLIAFNPIIDYLGRDEDIVYVDNFTCPQHYERLFVGANGYVYMCNSDEYGKMPLGHVAQNSIYEIWHGERLNEIRQKHLMPGGFLEFEMCKKCFYPRATTVDEKAMVNDRIIYIENYINRPQRIGE